MRGGDRWDAIVERHQRIDDDEVIAGVEQTLELLARLLRQHDQGAVRQPVHEPLEKRDLAVVLVLGGREDGTEVMLLQRLGRAGEDGREVGRVDERDEQPDEPGSAVREAARAPVRDVAPLLDDAGDELPRLRRHVAAAVEHAGDGGDRHAGLVRDLADRHPGVCELGHRPIEACSGNFFGSGAKKGILGS